MWYDTALKWIKFNLILMIIMFFHVYNGYVSNKCDIISQWFQINFMKNYVSIIILFMQCILTICLLIEHIMHILVHYFYEVIKYLSNLAIGHNSIALVCHIITHNERKKNKINHKFFQKSKNFPILFHIRYIVCQVFIHVTGIKMDTLILFAIILIIIDNFLGKYASYNAIFNDNSGVYINYMCDIILNKIYYNNIMPDSSTMRLLYVKRTINKIKYLMDKTNINEME